MTAELTFGGWLKRRRRGLGFTQAELGRRVGYAEATIRKIEADELRPSRQLAEKLADELNIPPDERAAFIRFARAEAGDDQLVLPTQTADLTSQATPAPPNNLPRQLTSLIGREMEGAAVQRLLGREEVGLVTLVGPGGTGKTRLGLQVATELLTSFEDGVYFVNLAPIRDPRLVMATIAQTLDIREQGRQGLLDSLKDHLRDKHMLLILDNFEQVAPAAPVVAALLAACPSLKVLVTSREALHLSGEHEFPVPPLAVPRTKPLPAIEPLSQYAAVKLFIQRALAVKPDFTITNENAPAVAEICHRLDGLPLAIELAAARIKLLPPEAMLARLESRLKLLTGGPRDLPSRQQTLRSTIDWSYNLLTEEEKKLFRRLSVFLGGRTLEAAEAVCNAPGDLAIDVLDGLSSLVDKSLLKHGKMLDGEPRFVMLETIWEYGLEQLEMSGEAETIRRAHAEYYLKLVETAERHLWGGDQPKWLDRLELEHDNLRAALTWYTSQEDGVEPALLMAGNLWRFWDIRGHWTEGRRWLDKALARRDRAALSVRWIPLHGAGNLATSQAEYEQAKVFYKESLTVTRQLDHKHGIANTLLNLGCVAQCQGDYTQATALHEEALSIHRQLGGKIGMALALTNLTSIAVQQGDDDRSAALAEESLKLYQELRDTRGVGWALQRLGIVAHRRGAHERAAKLLEECRAIYQKLEARLDLAKLLHDLGTLALDQGEYEQAESLYKESLPLYREMSNRAGITACLKGLASTATFQQQFERAARLFGAAEGLHDGARTLFPAVNGVEYDRAIASVRDELGEEHFASAQAEGRAMTLEQAVAHALV